MHSAGQTEDNNSCKPSLIIFSVKIIIIIIIYPLKCFTSENHRQWFRPGKLGHNTLVINLSLQTIPQQCMELFAV